MRPHALAELERLRPAPVAAPVEATFEEEPGLQSRLEEEEALAEQELARRAAVVRELERLKAGRQRIVGHFMPEHGS